MRNLILIEHRSGSAVLRQFVNPDYIVEFRPDSKQIVCSYGDKGLRTFNLTDACVESLMNVVGTSGNVDSEAVSQMQSDIDFLIGCCAGILTWCNALNAGEDMDVPAILLTSFVSEETANIATTMYESLIVLNERIKSMKANGDAADSHAIDPDKQ